MNRKIIFAIILLFVVIFINFIFDTKIQNITNANSQTASIKSIRFSEGYGMMQGGRGVFITSDTINEFTDNVIYNDQGGIDYVKEFKKVPISTDVWNSIIGTLDIEKFNSLPEEIDCKSTPNYCLRSDGSEIVDGGGITIEIDDGTRIKEFSYSTFNHKIPELNSFMKKMDEIQLEMKSVQPSKGNPMAILDRVIISMGSDEYIDITSKETQYSRPATIKIPTPYKHWHAIMAQIDFNKLNHIPDNIVCDSCAGDKKSLWTMYISQKYPSQYNKKIVFYEGNAPELDSFVKAITDFTTEIKQNEAVKSSE